MVYTIKIMMMMMMMMIIIKNKCIEEWLYLNFFSGHSIFIS